MAGPQEDTFGVDGQVLSDDVVEHIRCTADIVSTIAQATDLNRDFRGACPFHGGTRRTLVVGPKTRLFHCFTCGESGDVFKFVMLYYQIEWPEAVRMVWEAIVRERMREIL